MKINILDAGLRRKPGHHFDYDRKLVKYLVEAGHDVHIYGYAEMEDEIAEDLRRLCPVTKLFRVFHYYPADRIDRFAGDLVLFERHGEVIAEDLKSVREADLWIWPSIRAHHLDGCTRFGGKTPIVACVHEDPGISTRTIEAQLWRAALLRARAERLPFVIGAIESELRHRFMPILPGGTFVMFAHPYDGPPIAKRRNGVKRIGFFGQQREEKGTNLMTRLFSRLVEDDYEILFQDSANVPKRIDHPNIKVLEFVEDITEHLRKCDLVVLPYDVEGYRTKGSGMLAACLSLGIPVVGPFDTMPGRIIEQFGVGPLFAWTKADAIYKAIKAADKNYAFFADNALRASREFLKRNSTKRYGESFLTAAKSAVLD
jgi:glycosyltransferase involved in cell wall biosynthesis